MSSRDQAEIRADYEEMYSDLRDLEEKQDDVERRLEALQRECAHPNIGVGAGPDRMTVFKDECPDCGYHKGG